MRKASNKLKLGKGAAFVKSLLRRLPQNDDVWESDLCPLEKGAIGVGLVVCPPSGAILAIEVCDHEPTVNDLATVLAYAMRRPALGDASRPRCIRLTDNPAWGELVPHLRDLGVVVESVKRLKACQTAIREFRQELRESRPAVPKWTNNTDELLKQDFTELCFTAALRWAGAAREAGWAVVHGTVFSMEAERKRIDHAWCERGETVVDLAMPVGSRIIERERYYRILQPDVSKVYSAEDAQLLSVRNGHDGPWDESEQLEK